MVRPDTTHVATAISTGNGGEHDTWVKYGKELSVHSRDELKEHISNTMNSKNTDVLEARGATIYADRTTGTAVVHDSSRPDQGIAFHPKVGVDTYLRIKTEIAKKELGRDPLVVTGGHDAFYDAKEQRDAAVSHAKSPLMPNLVADHGNSTALSEAKVAQAEVDSSRLKSTFSAVTNPIAVASLHEAPVVKVTTADAVQTQAGPGAEPVAGRSADNTPNILKPVVNGAAAAEAVGEAASGAGSESIGLGLAVHDGGAALKAAGRALGLAVNAATLEAAYDADGKKIGAHNGRAASGVAGGWAGAVAGAEVGAGVGGRHGIGGAGRRDRCRGDGWWCRGCGGRRRHRGLDQASDVRPGKGDVRVSGGERSARSFP